MDSLVTQDGIVVVGTVAFDTVAKVRTLPGNDETVRIQQHERAHGGAGANVAAALGQLGERPRLLSTVGEDFVDSAYERELNASGVNLELVDVVDAPTSRVYLFTDDEKRQQIYSYPGAVEQMRRLEIPETSTDRCHIAHFAAGNLEAYPSLMAELEYVIFDPGQEIFQHDIEAVRECLPHTEILVVNEHEFSYLEEQLPEATADLVEPTGQLEALLISRGEAGCEVHTAAGRDTVPAVSADVADPSGAGDAHCAGLVFGLSCGLNLTESVRLGSTIAGFVVEQKGAQARLPRPTKIRTRFEGTWGDWPIETASEEALSVPGSGDVEGE